MPKNSLLIIFSIFTFMLTGLAKAEDNFGQIIEINTRFHSFLGKPSWLLVIRDLDHGQNIPYLYDIQRGENYWLAFTYSTNYLIVASTLQIETYQPRYNSYRKYKIRNFCNLESDGKIIRGKSMNIRIEGTLSPYRDRYRCTIMSYPTAFSASNHLY